MNTNLIFRKQVVVEGVTKTIHRILPVELPNVDLNGWQLIGHTDGIEVLDNTVINVIAPVKEIKTVINNIEKFQSDVKGTAKLVRVDGVIKIVARKGKTTYNQTTPNSVCIPDSTKEAFFKECREYHGPSTRTFKFSVNDGCIYDKWNRYIDNQYILQRSKHDK